MICPNCGKEGTGRFCGNCGTALTVKNSTNSIPNGSQMHSSTYNESSANQSSRAYQSPVQKGMPYQASTVMLDPKKSTVCKSCGAQFFKKEKVCPRCGAKNKKPVYKRPWFIILIVLIVLGLFAKINNTSDYSEQNTSSANRSTTVESVVSETSSHIPEIKKVVVYQKNNVIITATGMEKDGSNWNVNLFIENNSSLNLGFNAHAYAVNGIMTKNNIYDMDCDVAAGKKANTALVIKNRILEEYGIKEIRCIDVLFWAYDNDASFKEFDTGQIEIQTSLFDNTHEHFEGKAIYDEKGIKVKYLGNDRNDYYFSIRNDTGSYFNFDFDEITINDFTRTETDFDLYDEIVLNKSEIVVTITVSDDFKTTNSIDEVSTIEWNMSIRPAGDHFSESKIGPIVFNIE